jgi:hypothetical protein
MDDDLIMEVLRQQLTAMLLDKAPLAYNDDGLERVKRATLEAWDAMDPVDRQKLVDDSYKFVVECLQ